MNFGGLNSGSITGAASGASGAAGSLLNGGASAGGFTVRADGSVTNAAGTVIGRVDASGNVLDASGNIIGRVNPLN